MSLDPAYGCASGFRAVKGAVPDALPRNGSRCVRQCFSLRKALPNAVIGENDFNLSVSTYVEKQDTRGKVDIKELNKQIAEIVAREQVLRDEIDKIIKEIDG